MCALKFINLESFINMANKNVHSLFKNRKPTVDIKYGKTTVIQPNMTRNFHSFRKNKYFLNFVEKLNTPAQPPGRGPTVLHGLQTTGAVVAHYIISAEVPNSRTTPGCIECYLKSDHELVVVMQVRFGYTDLKVPDFNDYRRESTKDPSVRNKDTLEKRKLSTSLIIMSGAITGAYATKTIVVQHIMFMAASADVLALSKIEVNLNDIPEGTNATIKWRGKPLFVKHRTQSDIEATRAVDINTLRDPATDEERCPYPEWLVVIGVCTHLGCVPISGIGDFPGGYYCPCHGSHFDGAGRARKGPAPTNLVMPQHTITDNRLVVG